MKCRVETIIGVPIPGDWLGLETNWLTQGLHVAIKRLILKRGDGEIPFKLSLNPPKALLMVAIAEVRY